MFLRLVASPVQAASRIRLQANRGVVTLRGVIPTAAADRPLRIAARTPGVRGVCAGLTIDPAAAEPRDGTRKRDRTVAEHVGVQLLLAHRTAATPLEHRTLDCRGTPQGTRPLLVTSDG